jgi:hypothetical protein
VLLVTHHLSLVTALLFVGGTANPKGVRQLTDKAEARSAASAQASFPSRGAREKAVPEKVIGVFVWKVATLRGRLLLALGQPLFERVSDIPLRKMT